MRLIVSLDSSSLRQMTAHGIALEVLLDDAVLVQRPTQLPLFLKYLTRQLFVAEQREESYSQTRWPIRTPSHVAPIIVECAIRALTEHPALLLEAPSDWQSGGTARRSETPRLRS